MKALFLSFAPPAAVLAGPFFEGVSLMLRRCTWIASAIALLALAAMLVLPDRHTGQTPDGRPGEGQKRGDKKPAQPAKFHHLLGERLDMKEFQQELSLKECLQLIIDQFANRRIELPILVDTEAFKMDNPDAPDIYETRIKFPPFPRQMTVATALRVALDRVATGDATYALMPDHLLITTYKRTSPEYKLDQKVTGIFEKRTLQAVLRELSESQGTTIILDNRIGEKANIEVNVTFLGEVTLAGALRVLTEMADLKVLVLDGAIFVTTPAHAEALRKEHRQQLRERKDMDLEPDPLWPVMPGFGHLRPREAAMAQ
jgi:hypothetical protein